ncbi:MAG: DUF92 domain-containing protein [Thermoplasmata archaeon]
MVTDLIILVILILLFLLSVRFRVFSRRGNIAALIVGAVIGFGGSLLWLLLMVIFAVTSFIATKAFFKQKEASRLQEGKHGERSSSNIIYAGIIGVVLALLNFFRVYWVYDYGEFFLLFAVSFSVINSDTFASEIGVIDRNVIMITNLRKTEPGVNGGISLLGSLASLIGGLIIGVTFSLFYFSGFNIAVVIFITIMGFIGSNIDSVLGATLENRGLISKGQVNLFSSVITVALSGVFIYFYALV